jgi:hypothetical protein
MRHAVEMRLAYLISWRGGRLTGPFKKMSDQSRVWSEMGHEAMPGGSNRRSVGLWLVSPLVAGSTARSSSGIPT